MLRRTPLLLRSLRATSLLVAALLCASVSRAQVPMLINYQGAVVDSAGNLIGSPTAENRKIKFTVYDATGAVLWAEEQTVLIFKGDFSVLLGSGGPSGALPRPALAAVFAKRDTSDTLERQLGVTLFSAGGVAGAEISPRQQIVSTAFALRAGVAEAVAAGVITKDSLANGAVETAQIKEGAVTESRISNANVTTVKIADIAVTTPKLADGAVTTSKLDDSAVTNSKLADAAVTTAKLADGSVTSAKLASDFEATGLSAQRDISLNSRRISLTGDQYHGLQYAATFGGYNVDGAILYGYAGGALGLASDQLPDPGQRRSILSWNANGIQVRGEINNDRFKVQEVIPHSSNPRLGRSGRYTTSGGSLLITAMCSGFIDETQIAAYGDTLEAELRVSNVVDGVVVPATTRLLGSTSATSWGTARVTLTRQFVLTGVDRLAPGTYEFNWKLKPYGNQGMVDGADRTQLTVVELPF